MARRLAVVAALAGCTHGGRPAPRTVNLPTPTVQVGACGDPDRDGIVSAHPKLEHADRDLDGDGRAEIIAVDRAMCVEQNCHWNVFARGECARYLGTFDGAALETLASKGDDNMTDVRAYWSQRGGRMLLQTYRFTRGGYRMTDVIQCRRAVDDRLECADGEH